ncbi:hypothetical protein H312_00015 [Anncaliia algerae PRA339]|uniref:Uncharacterized protein n=1 Tax=Anncaliia algerae PRA339 TaxID=1288291 RepID=A0A059F5H2_9MICR|nr:hypothetical protein H312_00015 [Anncaliia algerae PRA339]
MINLISHFCRSKNIKIYKRIFKKAMVIFLIYIEKVFTTYFNDSLYCFLEDNMKEHKIEFVSIFYKEQIQPFINEFTKFNYTLKMYIRGSKSNYREFKLNNIILENNPNKFNIEIYNQFTLLSENFKENIASLSEYMEHLNSVNKSYILGIIKDIFTISEENLRAINVFRENIITNRYFKNSSVKTFFKRLISFKKKFKRNIKFMLIYDSLFNFCLTYNKLRYKIKESYLIDKLSNLEAELDEIEGKIIDSQNLVKEYISTESETCILQKKFCSKEIYDKNFIFLILKLIEKSINFESENGNKIYKVFKFKYNFQNLVIPKGINPIENDYYKNVIKNFIEKIFTLHKKYLAQFEDEKRFKETYLRNSIRKIRKEFNNLSIKKNINQNLSKNKLEFFPKDFIKQIVELECLNELFITPSFLRDETRKMIKSIFNTYKFNKATKRRIEVNADVQLNDIVKDCAPVITEYSAKYFLSRMLNYMIKLSQ